MSSFPGLQSEGSTGSAWGEHMLAELAKQYDVQPNQIQDWKNKLIAGAEKLFGNGAVEARRSQRN